MLVLTCNLAAAAVVSVSADGGACVTDADCAYGIHYVNACRQTVNFNGGRCVGG